MTRDSPAALQERYDKEIQSVTTETDGTASANGVSDVTGRGEEPAAEGANDGLEQVIDSEHAAVGAFIYSPARMFTIRLCKNPV